MEIKEIKKDIYDSFLAELELKRRPEQAFELLQKAKQKDHLVEKLAIMLKNNNLQFLVKQYVSAQFFSLNYMPYLPKIEHITSKKGLERWEKVKDWFEIKIGKECLEKSNKNKLKISNAIKPLLELKKIIDVEEEEKKAFYNELEGFILCLDSTSLYNPRSILCVKCKYRKKCRRILKKRIPYLFKYRVGLIRKSTFIKNVKKHKLYLYF